MTEIFKAATVEEAKAAAAKKFGKDIRAIKFDIIEEGKKGVFGFGKKEAVVKAVYEEKTAGAYLYSYVYCGNSVRIFSFYRMGLLHK